MREPTADEALDGPEFPATAVIRSALQTATETDKPLRVIDDGRLVGVVDRVQILASMAPRDGE
jgi:glycine betaine/proline transport system ATP-binding protein